MAKKEWADGEVLEAIGASGINENMLQLVGFNVNTSSTLGNTGSDTVFDTGTIAITNVSKRLMVIAYIRCDGSDTTGISCEAQIKIGTAFATSTEKKAITLATATILNGEQALIAGSITIMFVDESTDFTGDDLNVYISANVGANVDAILEGVIVLGA